MTDKERREDEALINCIQEAYGYSDEQLLAEFEEIEASLSDSDFPGVEDRIYQKLMAKIAEDEASEAATEEDAVPVPALDSDSVPEADGEKVVRFSKKKVLLVGVLAAAFVGVLGGTAIGGRHYFFRFKANEKGISLDSGKYFEASGRLEDAYAEAEEYLDMPIMKLGYKPKGFRFVEIYLEKDVVIFYFEYNDKKIHFWQENKTSDTSLDVKSDRFTSENMIFNEWLQENIYLEEEKYANGERGYSATISIDNKLYRIVGQVEEEEIKKIAENLIFK